MTWEIKIKSKIKYLKIITSQRKTNFEHDHETESISMGIDLASFQLDSPDDRTSLKSCLAMASCSKSHRCCLSFQRSASSWTVEAVSLLIPVEYHLLVLYDHVSWRVSFKVRLRYWWVLCRQAKVLKVWPPHLQGPQRNPQSPRGSLLIRASYGHIWNWTWFLTLFVGLGKIYPPASTHQGTTVHFHYAKDLVLLGHSIQNVGWVRLRA